MDDKSKRRIRAIAKRLHWLMQIILGAVVILGIAGVPFLRMASEQMTKGTSTLSLLGAESIFSDQLLYAGLRNTEALATFLPQADKTELHEWGESIAAFMDQPCAVFYYDGLQTVNWPVLPESYQPYTELFEGRLKANEICNSDSPRVDTLGTVLFQRDRLNLVHPDSAEAQKIERSVATCGLQDSRERWGIIYNYGESPLAFVRKLQRIRDNKIITDPSVMVLDHLFHLRRSPDQQGRSENWTMKCGLRIFDSANDRLLFITADLDTTNRVYEAKFEFPLWWQIYESDMERSYRDHFNDAVSDIPERYWPKIVFQLIVMFVFALFYRWILRLTKPETVLSPSGD